jgi:hypothetical protein
MVATSKEQFYNYIKDLQIENYCLISVYKQFIERENLIYRALNGAHHTS